MSRLLLPLCWIVGHDNATDDDPLKQYGALIVCRRCNRDTTKGHWWSKVPYQVARKLVDIANWLYELNGMSPSHSPHFRGVDGKHLDNLGTKHSCDAYSYEHLQSMMKQEGAGYTLGQLFDESGWIEINDDNASEMLALINDDFEKRSNELEREKTMRIVRGEEPNE